jgi:hypothetical protein
MSADGTPTSPWQLKTPPGTASYTAYIDTTASPPLLVCQVGSTRLSYLARALDDLEAMLRARGDWVLLGAADEGKPAAEGTVEAWARAEDNPVGGWYGQRKGYRGRFALYVPPVLELLGRIALEHAPKNNRARAVAR